MPDLSQLRASLETILRGAGEHEQRAVAVCRAGAAALPMDGVAFTLMASDEQRETLLATDAVIAEVEQAQYTIGAGPSLTAFTSGRPVLIPVWADRLTVARWPVFASQVNHLRLGGLWVLPLRYGVDLLGVAVMYRHNAGDLGRDDLTHTLSALDLTTLALLGLREQGSGRGGSADARDTGAEDGAAWLDSGPQRRRQVHQATGMVMAQLGVTSTTAMARIRGHAFGTGSDVEQIADDIVTRRLRLEPDHGSRR